ncbi:MAG TPA: DNA polymerase III subunit beta [Mogibacterium sp.]|nr:DNA polymerase III subunit beta [Mogibacterium sp.]
MKFYCRKKDLNKAISNVSHAVPIRTTSKILEGILVEIKDGLMTLTATDTTIIIESDISVQSNENISFVVPARLFSGIISKLPEDEIMMEYSTEKEKLGIRSGGTKADIICFNSDDFPKMKIKENENFITLKKEDVRKIIKKTAFSASSDEFNGILTGVLLKIENGIMKMVGVDPFRIATYNIEIEGDYEVSEVIPAKLISDVSKIISDEGEEYITLEVLSKNVILKFDNNKVVINTFAGKYIDYERILNKDGDINVRVKKDDLLMSIDRASLLTSLQNNNLIRFNIENNMIVINSLNEEGNIEEKIEVIKDGEDIQIGLNSKYLKDVLSVIDEEEIIMNMKDSISPCIIKPLKGEKYKYLILPIRLN